MQHYLRESTHLKLYITQLLMPIETINCVNILRKLQKKISMSLQNEQKDEMTTLYKVLLIRPKCHYKFKKKKKKKNLKLKKKMKTKIN
jgi:hypothetical protein